MIHRLSSRFCLFFLCCTVALVLPADARQDLPSTTTGGQSPLRTATAPDPGTNAAAAKAAKTSGVFHPIAPGPADGAIASLTARMLEQLHYLKQPFDRTVSSKFLDRYMETLDPQHLHFTQGDLAQFERYRTKLGDMTVTKTGLADTTPADEIFNRFVERLQQRVNYANELLKHDTFKFDADERITVNRKDAPYPKDLDEAKTLWRERLRFEYLQEHLGKIDAKKKSETTAAVKNDSAKPGAEAAAEKPKTEAEEIFDTLTHRYQRNLKAFADWDNDDVLQIYLTALAHVYDPHSDYFGHNQLESFAIGMNLSLFGIGAELLSEDGYCKIRRLLPEGPAEKSKKINVEDRIVAVAQGDQPPVDVVDMRLDKAVQLIRGPKGTEVRLTVIPKGEASSTRKVVTLIRDEIRLEDQAAKAKVIELPNGSANLRLGVIDLPSFYTPFETGAQSKPSAAGHGVDFGKSTSADVARLLKKFKQENVGGVILDLRRNGGGSLEEAIKLTGLFIKEGPVVQVKDFEGNIQEDSDNDAAIAYDGPLIVLTSRFSASASEIVAGALQDYGRALIVGDSSTHGKGSVQSVNNLKPYLRLPSNVLTNDPGALKLTIKKFYRASGESTQKKGVVPDIVLPSVVNESKDIGETALENPLEWDTIKSAKFERLNRVEPYVSELRKRSTERVDKDKDFSYIREDIEQFKKLQADKTVSLNEKERLKEKEESDARQKARDKERLARKDGPEKTYELTLRLAGEPGLPPPVAKTNSLTKLAGGKFVPGSAPATNSVAITPRPNTDSEFGDDLDDEKAPAIDVTLAETEHILVDYLSVLRKPDAITAGRTIE